MPVFSGDIVEYHFNNNRATDGIEYWVEAVNLATEEVESIEPKKLQGKMPPIGYPSKETQRAELLMRLKEARAIMELIEEQLLKLDYEIHQDAIADSASSQHSDSNTYKSSQSVYFTPVAEHDSEDSHDSFVSISLESSDGKPSDLVKNGKKKRNKKPKTEGEKNRHINKVFIREQLRAEYSKESNFTSWPYGVQSGNFASDLWRDLSRPEVVTPQSD
ncbi:hypothetical protein FBEOM_13424 [Fusarium beomiforme]|uniref:Uncharacterized protein n=1 Tax=Fusarium beomiforme TaxID=44412 RepID=A0A9P5DS45_9HYPO|nr:hypothetical protein FBEOM_13424 [Fusarium beomiforme]